LASSSNGKPALALDAAPALATVDCGRGGGVPGDGVWLASLNATRTPDVEVSVLRGLEKGVPDAEDGAEVEDGGGATACETPGRCAPPSLARFGRLVRCCQSW